MSTVKDFLESISKPVPELPDVEDAENADGTWARKTKKSSDEAENDMSTVERRRLHVVTDDIGSKYVGEVVSSKAIFGDDELAGLVQRASASDSDDSEDDEDESVVSLSDEEVSDGEEEKQSGDEQMTEGSSEDDVQIDKDEVSENDESDEYEDNDAKEEHEDEETIKVANAMAAVNLESQKKKGESIRKQLVLWDRLMHVQIKLHAALRAYNQLPRGDVAKKLLKEADEETSKNYHQARKNMMSVIQTLMQAEDALLRGSKQTSGIVTGKKVDEQGEQDSEDEEIDSSADEKEDDKEEEKDSEDEADDDDDDMSIPDYREDANAGGDAIKEQENDSKQKKLYSLKKVESELAKRHKRFEPFRNATLKKWDERTRLVGLGAVKNAKNNFSGFESVVLKQITQIMTDKHRLIRRTQTKRADVERIGGNSEATYDVELFDDDDFYQQLLKDLIERKSAEVVDPIEMSKQWLEMQKLRQKRAKNKKVDTKASKGRKTRYVVIPKLVNYFPSAPEKVKWTHETRNQLFKSLFAA